MFDPKTQPPNTHLHPFNLFESKNDTYTSLTLGAKPQRAAQNYETYKSWSSVGGLQFSPEKVDDESGICSPPLWAKNSPPKSPINAKNSDKKLNITNISPSSRVQAIARGQRELMEMVRAMPESSYELSLKDLVEHHSHRGVENQRVQNQEDYLAEYKSTDCLVELDESLSKKASVKRQESGKKLDKKGKILVRSGSNINENKGLFLKMVFPINLGGKKKKKKANPYTKVSPNTDGNNSHQNSEDNKGSKVLVEKEWWKRRSSNSDESGISSNSASTGSSGSSGSSVSSRSTRRSISTRKKKGCLRGILPFHSKKSLSEK